MLITIRQVEGRDAMRRLAASLPRVVAWAATETAFAIRREEQQHFRQALDRPRPAVISAIHVQRARVTTGGAATSAVYVGHSDRGFQQRLDVALGLQEEGGRLTPGMLGRKRIAVPVNVERDAYGGMSRSTIPRLLRRKGVFVGRIGPKGGRPGSFGIYERESSRPERLPESLPGTPRAGS